MTFDTVDGSGPSKPVLRMPFPDESIRNVGEWDSRKPFSPPLPQAATPFASGPGTTFATTSSSSRENFF
ncbi:hypothetical protein TNCV_3105811 [Trichonephila clavipes]|nr:hypothetical protein TNCV_3105811 [Trichonephila clavipes]